ncbi:restriction endonuclease subunit S [Alcaligenaceae bacterium]|nr:restriction endonuclease subunit S [Alcaligenaceae bacterium]
MSKTVSESWRTALIGEICNIAIGGTPSRSVSEYWDSTKSFGHPWVSIRDLRKPRIYETSEYITDSGIENSNVKLVKKGTVLMSFKLSVGRVAYADRDLYTNEAIAAFIPKSKNVIFNQFLYQGLQSWNLLENIDQAVKGITLNKEKINLIEALLPPLPEQQKIATILSSVDDVIEKTHAQIDKLKELKTGMMQELLTKGIGHTEFKDSPVGRIPVEWDALLLDSVARRGSGHTPNKAKQEYWNGGIEWVSLSDSSKLDRLYITNTAKKISKLGVENSSAVIHPSGTVVLSRDAGVGKSAILTKDMAVSQHFMAWVCSKKLDKHFLYYVLQLWKPKFEAIAIGSTIKTIGLPFFKKLQIPIPPLQEQERIAKALSSVDVKIFELEDKHTSIEAIKKALMQDLLTGKVRVNIDNKEAAAA